MAKFSAIIKSLRIERGITQEQLAALLKVSRSTIGMYETGSREPDFETLEAIADIFNVDMDYLMGRSTVERKDPVAATPIPAGFQPLPKRDRIPRVGQIACGTPILAEENVEAYDEVPSDWHADFTLLCQGDSMEPKIKDGDVVAIHCQPQVENGEIAAVRIGEEATLKRVYCNGNTIILQAENPTFPPLVYSRQEAEDIHIEGKAVGLCRKL